MKLLVIDTTEPKDKDFNKPLFRYLRNLCEFDVYSYRHTSKQLHDEQGYSGVIVTGVPIYYSLYSIYNRAEHLEWLTDLATPTLGICLGHQVLGHLYGAEIFLRGEEETGLKDIHLLEADPFLMDLPPMFNAETLHSASVSLPEDFIKLARSENCQNEIMRHKDKQMYGCQFHPEFLESSATLLRNFVTLAQKYAN